MAKLDSLERQMQQAMRSKIIAENKVAADKLKPELEAAKQAQDALITDATKLKDARERTGQEGQGLWARLVMIAVKGQKEGIQGFIIVSLIEQTLGRVDEIDKRARATIQAYRGTIGAMLNAQADSEAWTEGRNVRAIKADVKDEDLGYATIRKVISAVTKGNERLAFENALTAFNKAVREASHNKPAVKESGAKALVAVGYKELTEFLTQVTEMAPVRAEKIGKDDTTARSELELEAADDDEPGEEMTQAAVNQ